MSAAASGAAAAAAAAERRRREAEEEEEMTPYTSEELAQGWEFKIVRSATGAFKDPAMLRKLLDEEARAGWTLVEKFDNARLRLKRPAAARERDAKLDFDPYRTWVGPLVNTVALAIVIGLVAAMLLFLIVVAVLANH